MLFKTKIIVCSFLFIIIFSLNSVIIGQEHNDTPETELRIVPFDSIHDTIFVNYIAKYSDASYKVWEAEGTESAFGEVKLIYNNRIGEIVKDKTATWVRTKTGINNDTLIKGPKYSQSRYFSIEPITDFCSIRIYEAEFILKIDTNPLLLQDSIARLESENDTVCVLRVAYTPSDMSGKSVTIDSMILRVSDLLPYNITKTKRIVYELDGIKENSSGNEAGYKCNDVKNIDFLVEWKGLSYLRLWVDKVIVSDNRGRELVKLKIFDTAISWQANNDYFIYPNSDNRNDMYEWFGVKKPEYIDNCEPVNYLNNLIKSTTGGKKQLVTMTNYGNSGLFEISPENRFEETVAIDELLTKCGIKNITFGYPSNEEKDVLGLNDIRLGIGESGGIRNILRNFNNEEFISLDTPKEGTYSFVDLFRKISKEKIQSARMILIK